MKRLVLTLLCASSAVMATPIDIKCPTHVIWGAPQIPTEGNNQYLCRTEYAVNLNYKTKVPYYVVEHIMANEIGQGTKRKDDFREDTAVPVKYRATLKDYANGLYDRGHMAPAGDFTSNPTIMSESFLLTNIMPQTPGNNRGIWNVLEGHVRDWAVKYKELYVITGTIYDDKFDTIGNGVGVPTYIYKIIINPITQKSIAFKFPNVKLNPKTIENYIVNIADIETVTGINFEPNLPKSLTQFESSKSKLTDW